MFSSSPSTEVKKFTMSCARIEDIDSRLAGILGNTKPTTLVIHVGMNNLEKDTPDTLRVRQKYCSLIRHTKYACPGAKLIMSGIFQRTDRNQLVTLVAQANELLQDLCAAYTVEYMDNSAHMNKKVLNLKQDGLHLTRTGARGLSTRLTKVVLNEDPFQTTQKGPDRRQEERYVQQSAHHSHPTNTQCWPLPPYPTHIMPRYPLLGARPEAGPSLL